MRYFFLLVPFFIFANNYIAKIEPKDEFSIYANTNGEITFLDKTKEMSMVNGVIVKIDNILEKENLNLYENLNIGFEKTLNDWLSKIKTKE